MEWWECGEEERQYTQYVKVRMWQHALLPEQLQVAGEAPVLSVLSTFPPPFEMIRRSSKVWYRISHYRRRRESTCIMPLFPPQHTPYSCPGLSSQKPMRERPGKRGCGASPSS